MKKIILFLSFALTSAATVAQDFPFGELDNRAMEMKKYDKDTSAHAVVLNEHGTSRIVVNGQDEIRLQFEYHVKIKFFDNKNFQDEGTIQIPVYAGESLVYENVTDIKGITFYKDDNGMVQKLELDPKKVYTVKEDKHWSVLKFAMPGLRDGCVIEVKYMLESPYIHNFHSWHFQGEIPKMYSEYEAHIPGFWDYNASLRGGLKLTSNKSNLERGCFTYHGASADCSYLVYGISDVPAFIEEDYMTSRKNFLSGITFELQQYTDLNTGAKIKVTKEWKNIDYELKTAYWFGSQLKRKDLLKERIACSDCQ